MNHLKHRFPALLLASLFMTSTLANATGVLPETSVLLISQKTNTAQMGVMNTDDGPLLLLTTIVDLPDSKGVTVFALPAVTRVEGHKRQIVRFMLDESEAPLTVQQLKRVLFEGVPVTKVDGKGKITTTIRHDLPVIISPAGLEQDPAPWTRLHLRWADDKLTLSNPSPFVVRLAQTVTVVAGNTGLKILPRTYVLPGETFSIPVPGGIAADVKSLRIQPASPYGFDVAPYDAPLER